MKRKIWKTYSNKNKIELKYETEKEKRGEKDWKSRSNKNKKIPNLENIIKRDVEGKEMLTGKRGRKIGRQIK